MSFKRIVFYYCKDFVYWVFYKYGNSMEMLKSYLWIRVEILVNNVCYYVIKYWFYMILLLYI